MENQRWTYPYNARGRRMTFSDMPEHIRDLEDDEIAAYLHRSATPECDVCACRCCFLWGADSYSNGRTSLVWTRRSSTNLVRVKTLRRITEMPFRTNPESSEVCARRSTHARTADKGALSSCEKAAVNASFDAFACACRFLPSPSPLRRTSIRR